MSNRYALLSIALVFAAGCGSEPKKEAQQPGDTAPTKEHDVEPAKPVAAPDPTPEAAVAPAEEKLTDDRIVGIVVALNQGEIDQAAVAEKKAKSAKVKALAHHMSSDHTTWLKQGNDLAKKDKITPADSPIASQLKSDSAAVVSNLQGLSGADFDKAYVDAQVKGHQDALDLIDKKLLTSVQAVDLKDMIAAVRPKIADHLKHAQDEQAGLAAPATGGKTTK